MGPSVFYKDILNDHPRMISDSENNRNQNTIFFLLSQKITSSVSVALFESLLSLTGYVSEAEKISRSLLVIRVLAGIVPGGIFLVSILVVSRYPISREEY